MANSGGIGSARRKFREIREPCRAFCTLARRAACAAALRVLAGAALPAGASSLSGAYLAAMQADFRNDYGDAALYFDRALALDPENPRC